MMSSFYPPVMHYELYRGLPYGPYPLLPHLPIQNYPFLCPTPEHSPRQMPQTAPLSSTSSGDSHSANSKESKARKYQIFEENGNKWGQSYRQHREKKGVNQKSGRNVHSNLLRIFFKNLLEMRVYDRVLDRAIRNNKWSVGVKEFHRWLREFGVNFKNYVRVAQVKAILACDGQKEMVMLLRLALRHYLEEQGKAHSLTSRRIEQSAIPQHLEGLRELASYFF